MGVDSQEAVVGGEVLHNNGATLPTLFLAGGGGEAEADNHQRGEGGGGHARGPRPCGAPLGSARGCVSTCAPPADAGHLVQLHPRCLLSPNSISAFFRQAAMRPVRPRSGQGRQGAQRPPLRYYWIGAKRGRSSRP
jgi:hypothetical protein